MATLAVNTDKLIQFVNYIGDDANKNPALFVQAGEWKNEEAVEAGIVFDIGGEEAPLLDAKDARKLARWLTRAADLLDGSHNSERKNKQRHYYEEEDDDFSRYT